MEYNAKEITKKYLNGIIQFEDFYSRKVFREVVLFFDEEIKKNYSKDFVLFFTKCFLYFDGTRENDSLYSFFLKEKNKCFKKIKKLGRFLEKELSKFNSRIHLIDFIYIFFLTLYYVLYDEEPTKYSDVMCFSRLVIDTGLDRVVGGKVDSFIIDEILNKTLDIPEYYQKKAFVKKKFKKSFFDRHFCGNLGYELKGKWPINSNGTPMLLFEIKESMFTFINENNEFVNLLLD